MGKTTEIELVQWSDVLLVEKAKEKHFVSRIMCAADDEKQLVYGVAMEPDEVDAHGEYTKAEDIERAAHGFMVSRMVGIQHEEAAQAEIVESYIAQSDITVGDQLVRKGSWVVCIHVLSPNLWKQVKAGEFGGISIGGYAERVPDGE